jgi:CheY-like chemotaxis protein
MNQTILLVDDEDDILYLLDNVLSKGGFTVLKAKSGEECFKILKKEKPDLIFMDIMMPGINGWDTARTIKKDPKTKDIPILMISILDDFQDKRKSIEYGLADDHLFKPIDTEVLLQTTETFLSANAGVSVVTKSISSNPLL